MVKSVEVKNFKSLSDLKLDLGRINVFIGENGSGKSNILEAVAFGAAAYHGFLDKDILTSRGLRWSEPHLMRSAFIKDNIKKDVLINFSITLGKTDEIHTISNMLSNDNRDFSKWDNLKSSNHSGKNMGTLFMKYFLAEPIEDDGLTKKVLSLWASDNKAAFEKAELLVKTIKNIRHTDPESFKIIRTETEDLIHSKLGGFSLETGFDEYKIYAPENTFLRRFEDDEAGDPLGIKGQGLFKLLHYFQTSEDKSSLTQIKEALSALDWFEDFTISSDLAPGERKLSIKDRFLDEEITISQNNANEGFLFILFYISLFVSKDAPSFFAIDNLDASFNPKLCKHITKTLVKLAKDNDKQALFTTHNPFILDGLDLTDDEQRLFVVYRGSKGNTVVKRVTPGKIDMPLSEQWMNGFLGGLPKNF